MHPSIKVYLLDDQNRKFFGEGPYTLLSALEKNGSLRSAAESMNMAYSKAIKLLKQAEAALGFPLTTRSVGGKNGGGSCLTPQGKELLIKYDLFRRQCIDANRRIYSEIFGSEQ